MFACHCTCMQNHDVYIIKIPQVAQGKRGTFFLGLKSALEVRRLQVAMPNEMLDV